jgi:hypothetical protein
MLANTLKTQDAQLFGGQIVTPKTVVLEVDGVLAQLREKIDAALYSEFGEDALANQDRYFYEARFENRPDILRRVNRYMNEPRFFIGVEPNQAMVEFVNRLIELEFGVMFVTWRPRSHEEVTRRWLERYVVKYSKTIGLFMEVDNKAEFLRDVFVDFAIDDNPRQISLMKQRGINGFAYDAPYNVGYFPRIVHDRNGEVYLQLADDQEPFHLLNSYL